MSDDPRVLKSILLEEATTEQQQEFAKMLAKQCAEAELQAKGHRCHCFIPNRKEYEIMAKYNDDDTCPKCGSGRILLEIFHGNFGENYLLRCYFSKQPGGCDFKEEANDPDRW